MKQLFSALLCIIALLSLSIPAYASNDANFDMQIISNSETTSNDGICVTEELFSSIVYSSSSTQRGSKTKTYTVDGTKMAMITVFAEFCYNGSTVSVVSKKISKKELYNGWTFSQSSFTSSGGTVTLKGNLKKNGYPSKNVSISITCDKNGKLK